MKLLVFVMLFVHECWSDDAFSDEWVAKIDAPLEIAYQIIKRHGFQYINKIEDGVYILKHQNMSRYSRSRASHIFKRLISEPDVRSLEQQKWNKRSSRNIVGSFAVNDSKWSRMWYLNGNTSPDLTVYSAWESGHTGKGVSIAIVDTGVDVDHPDLKPNYNPDLSIDVFDRDDDPKPSPNVHHGTECAGIALAKNNKECVIGVAFDASLIAVRVLGPLGATDTMERDALLIKDVDIFSNSWGSRDKLDFSGPGRYTKVAIEQGIKQGRNGLGSIYVWAAGNGGSDDNCNCDGFVNSIYTIGINAVSAKHTPPGYAEPCTAVLAATFSGSGSSSDNICSTDLNGGCTESFTGTSAATPIASGILALVLQESPELTWRDMQHIIVNSSESTGLKYGKLQTNGAGKIVSDYFGFGLLKAQNLIDVAKQWQGVPRQRKCVSKKVIVNKRIEIRNPKRVVTSSINSKGCIGTENEIKFLEHVEVEVQFDYSLRGSVQLTLISPSGLRSRLLTRRGDDTAINNKQIWTYMSVQHWGENPEGDWKLELSLDMDWGEFGVLVDWSITMYGTKTDPIFGKDDEKDENNTTVDSVHGNQTGGKDTQEETSICPRHLCVIIGPIFGIIFIVLMIVCGCLIYKKCTKVHPIQNDEFNKTPPTSLNDEFNKTPPTSLNDEFNKTPPQHHSTLIFTAKK